MPGVVSSEWDSEEVFRAWELLRGRLRLLEKVTSYCVESLEARSLGGFMRMMVTKGVEITGFSFQFHGGVEWKGCMMDPRFLI